MPADHPSTVVTVLVVTPEGTRQAIFDLADFIRLLRETGGAEALRARKKGRGKSLRLYLRCHGRDVPAGRYAMSVAPGDQVHHINGNPFDNRRANLVLLDASEHGHQHRRRGRTGYRSVYPTLSQRFRARFGGIHVGCYPTARLAALAYDRLARRFMREPRLNVPDGGTPEEMLAVERGLGPTAWVWVHIPANWHPWRDTPADRAADTEHELPE